MLYGVFWLFKKLLNLTDKNELRRLTVSLRVKILILNSYSKKTTCDEFVDTSNIAIGQELREGLRWQKRRNTLSTKIFKNVLIKAKMKLRSPFWHNNSFIRICLKATL